MRLGPFTVPLCQHHLSNAAKAAWVARLFLG